MCTFDAFKKSEQLRRAIRQKKKNAVPGFFERYLTSQNSLPQETRIEIIKRYLSSK